MLLMSYPLLVQKSFFSLPANTPQNPLPSTILPLSNFLFPNLASSTSTVRLAPPIFIYIDLNKCYGAFTKKSALLHKL